MEVKFFPAVAGHGHAWIFTIPRVQGIEVLGAKKQRYGGAGLHQISQGAQCFRHEHNI